MTTIRNAEFSKVLAAVAIVGMIALGFSFAVPQAQASSTVDIVCALVNCDAATRAALEAVLGGSSTGSSFTFTRDLTVGSTGQDVMELQKFLNNNGYAVAASGAGSAGGESTYFGSLTQTALAKYQAAKGIAPAVGYFGPITRVSVNAQSAGDGQGSTGSTGSTGSSSLSGGAGSLSDVDFVSKLSGEEVGEGQDDVEVAGLDIEADDSSDIEITAVNLNFSKSTGATRDFYRYADEVSIWYEGEEVARVDARDFQKDNNYDRTISLDSGAIIRAGERGDLTVAVSAVTNLDTSDAGDAWTLEFESVRYKDAQGAIITDSSTGDINDGTGKTFTFENFATATNVELVISNGDEDVNDARVILASDTQDTDDVEIFSFKLKAKGDSDIVIDDLPVKFVATGTGSPTIVEIANTARLYIDGELVKEEAIPSTATTTSWITFSNFNYTIDAGDTVEAVIQVDLNDIDGSTFQEDNTLLAAFGETETDGVFATGQIDAEDEEGNTLVDADMTGSATSEAHVFYINAFSVSNISTSVITQDVSDTLVDVKGVYTISFDVTALGADIYIASSTGSTSDDSKGIEWSVTGGTFVGNGTSDLSAASGLSQTASSAYKVNDGQTQRFTLQVSLDNQAPAAGFFGVQIDSINFIDSEDTSFAATAAFLGANANYTALSTGLTDLETSRVNLN